MRISKILTLLVIIPALTACHSTKQAVSVIQPAQPVVKAPEAEKPWTDVTIPIKLRLTSPKQFALSGRATFINDSLLAVSMRVLGMEVANLAVTPDSVWMLDKIHKYYFAEPLQALTGSWTMPFAELQMIAMGATARGTLPEYTITDPKSGREVTLTFDDFADTPTGMAMPGQIGLTVPLLRATVSASLTYDWQKASWNRGIDVASAIKRPGKGWKRITMADGLTMLKGL